MYSYLLQDWTSPKVAAADGSLIQSEADWLSFQPYQDIIFYVECKGVDTGGTDHIALTFETSPSKDESMFQKMTEVHLDPGTVGTVQIAKVILSQNPDVPLARFVRWRLKTDSASTDWSATFRVYCAANAVGPL